MKLAQLLEVAEQKETIYIGQGASRVAFYVSGHSSDVIKKAHSNPSEYGGQPLLNARLRSLFENYLQKEELKIALKYLKLAQEGDLDNRPLYVTNVAICTERAISTIVDKRGNLQKHDFARCKEIIEKGNVVYGRYENAKYKKSRKTPTWQSYKVQTKEGRLVARIEDMHPGNIRKGVILDFASVEF